MYQVKIIENAWLAKLAAQKLKACNAAIVIGSTIYLYGVSKTSFLNNPSWVRHELKHVEQYRKLSTPVFIVQYLYQCIRFGYYRAPLEVAARRAEMDECIIKNYRII